MFFAHAGEKKLGVAHNKQKTEAGQIGMKTGEFPPCQFLCVKKDWVGLIANPLMMLNYTSTRPRRASSKRPPSRPKPKGSGQWSAGRQSPVLLISSIVKNRKKEPNKNRAKNIRTARKRENTPKTRNTPPRNAKHTPQNTKHIPAKREKHPQKNIALARKLIRRAWKLVHY